MWLVGMKEMEKSRKFENHFFFLGTDKAAKVAFCFL